MAFKVEAVVDTLKPKVRYNFKLRLLVLLLVFPLARAQVDVAGILSDTIGESGVDFLVAFSLIFAVAILAAERIFHDPEQETAFNKMSVIVAGIVGFSTAYYVTSNKIPFTEILGSYGLLLAFALVILLGMYIYRPTNEGGNIRKFCQLSVVLGIGLIVLSTSIPEILKTTFNIDGDSGILIGSLLLLLALVMCRAKKVYEGGTRTITPTTLPTTSPTPSSTPSPTPSSTPTAPNGLKTRVSPSSPFATSLPTQTESKPYTTNNVTQMGDGMYAVNPKQILPNHMDDILEIAQKISSLPHELIKEIKYEEEIKDTSRQMNEAVDKAVKYGRKALYLINLADVNIVNVSQLADNFEKIEKELNQEGVATDKHRTKLVGYKSKYEGHSIQKRSFFKEGNLKREFLGMGSADEVRKELEDLGLMELDGKHLKEILGALHDHIVDMLNMHEDIIKLDAKFQQVLNVTSKITNVMNTQVLALSRYTKQVPIIMAEIQRLESVKLRTFELYNNLLSKSL